MVSLELEARLDNLLSTSQEETNDIDLFAPIAEKEECPICMIPLPIVDNETIFMKCCGKCICKGCMYKNLITEGKKIEVIEDYKCAFCCQPPIHPKNQVKALKKLMKNNNPEAFIQMATNYEEGEGVIQSDTRALEMSIRAAELDHAEGFTHIGLCYKEGTTVERDLSKSIEFLEVSAKKGSVRGSQISCSG